jgi:prophage lambdaBa01, membrane protein, putative|uniref:Minor tail protein n=1 Tax=Siphoviridae sp. ctNlb4 TaxID=2826305 RepID=A0A8S5QV31_9CAUD|nr:MAG TPA: minor tail protein [Siphoviridae sp. ctNlb4]
MGVTLDELKVMIDAEIAPFKNKMKEVENRVKDASGKVQESTNKIKAQSGSMLGTFAKLAKFAGLAYLGKKMLDVGMYSTQMALEVTAAVNQIKRQMGESSQTFLKWVNDNANAMNMGVGEATKYGAVYSNLFSGFIKDSNKLSAYTAKMLQTSAVVAEGSGRSITDVMERIRSGLLGNTEAIEDLGINVNVAMIQSTEAFKRFANGQSWDQLDYQTQQQIRLMAILEQATAKYGTTLSQSVNGRISLFKSLLKDAALNVGNAFLPIVNAVMPVLNSFAMVLKNVTAKLAEFIALMFNKKATVKDGGVAGAVNDMNGSLQDAAGGAGDLADAMGDADDASGGMADNLDDTAKSAKKAVKELLGLMGFDEINLLGKKDDSGDDDGAGKGKGGGGGGKGKKGKGGGGAPFKDILPEVALTDMDNQFKSIFDGLGDKLKGLFDLFGKGFNAAFRAEGLERIKIGLGQIKTTLGEIATDPRVVNAFNGMTKKIAYALGQIAGSIGTVGVGIGVFLSESIANGLGRQKERIIRALVAEFENTGNMFASAGNIAQAFADGFYDVITSTGAIRIGSSIVSSILAISSIITEISYKFGGDLMKGIERIVTDNMPGIAEIFSNTLSDIAPIFESAEQAINDMVDSISRVYDNYIRPSIESSTKAISGFVSVFVKGWNNHIQPVIKKIGQGFSDTIGKHISPLIQKILDMVASFQEMSQVINAYLAPVISFIVDLLIRILAPAIEYIVEVFRVLFNTAADILGGIADFLKGVFDIITGILTGDISKIFDGFTETGDAIMNILSTILTGLLDLTVAALKVIWDTIVAIFQGIWDGIVAVFSPVAEWFAGVFQAAWDGIIAIFTDLATWFGDRWTEVATALSNIGTWFTDMFQKAWNGLTGIFANIGTWFGERWNDVTNALANVATWFGSIFSSAYNAVVNAFSSIGGFFSGVWSTVKSIFVNAGQAVGSAVGGAFRSAVNGVLGTIENVVNGFIGMINGVIGMINKIPGVSLGSIGYVSLPRLARGGIVDSPTVAMIGEAGKEVVMPLENTGFLQTMGRVVGGAVVNALGGGLTQSSGFSGSGDIVIQIGGHEFGRVAIQEINREQERAGQVLLNI